MHECGINVLDFVILENNVGSKTHQFSSAILIIEFRWILATLGVLQVQGLLVMLYIPRVVE